MKLAHKFVDLVELYHRVDDWKGGAAWSCLYAKTAICSI